MIFWGYLIRAIRNPNSACAPTPRPWLQAPCFKFWAAVSVISGLLLFGATSIETTDLDAQRVRLLLREEVAIMLMVVIPLCRHFWSLPSVCPHHVYKIQD